MMTATDTQKIVVLRLPEVQGNFRFWLAELSEKDARHWQERIATESPFDPEISRTFGDPLTLPQVMEKLQNHDFQVLDFPHR